MHAGEVLGIAGVEGNGQTELVETIMGMRKPSGGTIELVDADGKARDLTKAGTLARREAGIGYIAEDRTRHSLLLTQPLWVNRILGYQTREPVSNGQLLDIAGRPRRHRADRRASTTSARRASTSRPRRSRAATSRS